MNNLSISYSYTINPISDYSKMLNEFGVTDKQIKHLSYRTDDLIEIKLDLVELKESKIEGTGLFFKKDISNYEVIGDARINDKRTQLGRYTNHSDNPNVKPKIVGERMIYIAIMDIKSGEEMTIDYRETRALAIKLNDRSSIIKLHKEIEKIDGHLLPEDFKTIHHFSEGVYVREFHMDKGIVVVGKIHRHNHIAMLIKGKAIVNSEQGKLKINAPHIWSSKAGEKRAVYAEEDCIFVTIHPTYETDLEKIEEEVIAPNYEALEKKQ